jgi:hypothetical protein
MHHPAESVRGTMERHHDCIKLKIGRDALPYESELPKPNFFIYACLNYAVTCRRELAAFA